MAKNNKTHFFYVLYSDKTWVFNQSEHVQGPIYIIMLAIVYPPYISELISVKDTKGRYSLSSNNGILVNVPTCILLHGCPQIME